MTFTAKVTGNGGSPGGTVVFSANGTAIGTPATLDATGTATATTSGFVPGSYTITAVYGGDTNDQGSTGTGAAPLVVGTIPTATDLGNVDDERAESAGDSGGHGSWPAPDLCPRAQ